MSLRRTVWYAICYGFQLAVAKPKLILDWLHLLTRSTVDSPAMNPTVAPESQFARRLAESGCLVVVPVLIDRKMEKRNGRANLSNREYIYRSAFELGRHLIGYELQKLLAVVDWFAKDAPGRKRGVIGWGEGGELALYAAALDSRIDAACVSGYFTSRQNLWSEPIYRNVFGLLREFGDAEIATMISPRAPSFR